MRKQKNRSIFKNIGEGTVGYADMWCIIKDTKNYDLACKWLDFMTGGEFQYNFATVEGNAHNTVNNNVCSKPTDEQKALVWALEFPSRSPCCSCSASWTAT